MTIVCADTNCNWILCDKYNLCTYLGHINKLLCCQIINFYLFWAEFDEEKGLPAMSLYIYIENAHKKGYKPGLQKKKEVAGCLNIYTHT